MTFIGAAYVIVETVDGAILLANAFYANYANWSQFGTLLYLWELLAIVGFEGWSLAITITGLVSASNLWTALESRLAEAKEGSLGIETPVRMDLAIKVFTLCMIAGLSVMISGYSLG